jgi:hypothetical protein
MDTETAEAIDRVGQHVDTLEMSLRGEIAALREEVREQFSDVRQQLADVREHLADNRRHATIQFESLGHDIRIIAEGVASLAVKVDRLR